MEESGLFLELKLVSETTLEASTSSFLEKERELQSKIEELEDKVEEFSQSIALQKVYRLQTQI
ncbi:hypothetical protein AHAS_Ahas20G0279800 [Arachis hypogaea]